MKTQPKVSCVLLAVLFLLCPVVFTCAETLSAVSEAELVDSLAGNNKFSLWLFFKNLFCCIQKKLTAFLRH